MGFSVASFTLLCLYYTAFKGASPKYAAMVAANQAYLFMLKSFVFKTSLTLSLVLGCCERVIGVLTLSPTMVAPVCHVGDPLQLTCTASVEFIKWSILRGDDRITEDLQINSRDANQMKQVEETIAIFTFARTSAQGASPLISTLSIDTVGIDLNGTVVWCLDVANPLTSASTTIQIIDISNNQNTPLLHITSEEYVAGNVTVTMEWDQQQGITYCVGVTPLTPLITTGSTNCKLVLQYNKEYNFTVVAIAPCRPDVTTISTLTYANCGHPKLLSTVSNDSVPNIVGYDDIIPVEGTTIRFSCPPGLVVTGPDSATCMENGEWESDPSGVTCTDSKGLNQDEIIAVASSEAAVSILASVLLLTGCLYRLLCPKKKRLIDTLPPAVTYRNQLRHYDDVQFPPKREVPM